ncbi:MAG: ATP-binding protein [Bacillota bacterium]
MECSTCEKQVSRSDRWIQFLESTAIGLNLNFTVVLPEESSQFHVPASCPECKKEQTDLSQADIFKILSESGADESITGIDCGKMRVMIIPLQGSSFVVARQCPCNSLKAPPPVEDRAAITQKLLYSFRTTLKESFEGGHLSMGLSTLRQINHIILSLFAGDRNAVTHSLDLILSALLILLDARGSWLELPGKTIVKGDDRSVRTQLGFGDDPVETAEVRYGNIYGTLGVLAPADSSRAKFLLPLMARECAIVIEVDTLFKLLHKQLSGIFGTIGTSIILVNRQGNISYINKSAEKLLGNVAINLIGSPVEGFPAPWVTHIKTGKFMQVNGFMDAIGESDNRRWIDWELSPLSEGEEYIGWVILVNDCTDRHRWQEAAREAERLVATASLVGSLAHELRNPLAAAKSMLQLMGRKNDTVGSGGYTDLIMREIDRVIKLLNEFLLLGKPSNFSPEPVNLKSFLLELQPLLNGSSSTNTGITLDITADDVPPIAADPGQLTQVILNLVRNAVEACPDQGRVTITLEHTGDMVCLSVKDSGPGITPDHMDKIFTPFYTTKERGTGLGLPVVQAIVHNHGGEIRAENSPDGGAVFTINFPPHPKSSNRIYKVVDVIIITEDILIRYPAEQALRSAGFSIVSFDSPENALRQAEHFRPKTIIIGRQFLEKMDVKHLQQIWPEAEIMILGNPDSLPERNEYKIIQLPLKYSDLIKQLHIAINIESNL